MAYYVNTIRYEVRYLLRDLVTPIPSSASTSAPTASTSAPSTTSTIADDASGQQKSVPPQKQTDNTSGTSTSNRGPLTMKTNQHVNAIQSALANLRSQHDSIKGVLIKPGSQEMAKLCQDQNLTRDITEFIREREWKSRVRERANHSFRMFQSLSSSESDAASRENSKSAASSLPTPSQQQLQQLQQQQQLIGKSMLAIPDPSRPVFIGQESCSNIDAIITQISNWTGMQISKIVDSSIASTSNLGFLGLKIKCPDVFVAKLTFGTAVRHLEENNQPIPEIVSLNMYALEEEKEEEFSMQSRFSVFRRTSDVCSDAIAHFQSVYPNHILQALLIWLSSYRSLFTERCSKCKCILFCDSSEYGLLPPCFRSFTTPCQPSHSHCVPAT